MRNLITLTSLMACLAIMTLPAKEANAYCLVKPGKNVKHYAQRGKKIVIIKNGDEKVVAYIKNKGNSSLSDCYPRLMYDTTKLKCRVETNNRPDWDDSEMETNHRVFCRTLGKRDHRTYLRLYTLKRHKFEIWSFKTDAMILVAFQKLGVRITNLGKRVTKVEAVAKKNGIRSRVALDAAADAYGAAKKAQATADKAKKRKSANMDISMMFYYTFYHQGADIRYANDEDRFWPSGGIGLGYAWWFKGWALGPNSRFELGVKTRMRWHRLVLTIDGAPQDDDVPGDQYEMRLGLNGRFMIGKYVSLGFFVDTGVGLFHHQQGISQQDDNGDVEGPEQNVSFNWILGLGGSLNFHLDRFFFGFNLLGSLNVNALLHPNFEGEPRYGNAKHLYFGLMLGYSL